jgi:hypothetical protein
VIIGSPLKDYLAYTSKPHVVTDLFGLVIKLLLNLKKALSEEKNSHKDGMWLKELA